VDRLTRRQEGSVKVGFAEGYDPPEIGLYANHIFQFFGSDHSGGTTAPDWLGAIKAIGHDGSRH
jgi:hypothetical protein